MTRIRGVRLVTLALTTAVVLGTPVAAHAERVVTHDPAGDVIYQDSNDLDEAEDTLVLAPNNTAVDITRTTVNHRADRLRLGIRLRDLHSRGLLHTAFQISTPQRSYRLYAVREGGRRAHVQAFLETDRGSEVKCPGLRASLDPQTDTVTASVPSKCVNSPRWVKIGAATYTIETEADRTTTLYFSDDAHQTGISSGDALSYTLAMGPKVRRS